MGMLFAQCLLVSFAFAAKAKCYRLTRGMLLVYVEGTNLVAWSAQAILDEVCVLLL